MPATAPTPRIDAAASGTWTLGDLEVNRLGFGSMRLTVDPDRERALQVVRRAVELGVNHIDTAAFYVSPGGILTGADGPKRYAADLIREALADVEQRVVVATKVGPGIDPETGEFHHTSSVGDLRRQVEENLHLLDVDRLDVVDLRMGPEDDAVSERFTALAALQEEGLITHLGLSNVRRRQLDEAEAIAPVVCVQNPYAVDLGRDRDDLVLECARRGIAYVPFFSLAGPRRAAGAATDHPRVVKMLAQIHHVTPHQLRLAWALHQGHHLLAIPGTGDLHHLEQNIAAASIRLSNHELSRLETELDAG